jgi:hypothetical protein
LDCDPPILCFPPSLGWQMCSLPPPAFFCWDRVFQTFLLILLIVSSLLWLFPELCGSFLCVCVWGGVFELRAMCLLGRCSTTWGTMQILFALGIFWIGSHIYAWVDWTMILLFSLPTFLGWQVCATCPAFIGWDRVWLMFCPGWPWTMILLSSTSQ